MMYHVNSEQLSEITSLSKMVLCDELSKQSSLEAIHYSFHMKLTSYWNVQIFSLVFNAIIVKIEIVQEISNFISLLQKIYSSLNFHNLILK